MSRRHWAIVVATALLALAAFAAGLLAYRPGAGLPPQSSVERLLAAPLSDPAGVETTLARWRGRPLLVNFWATWCPPCLTEMPIFSRLQEKHPGVQFVGIAVDTANNVRDFSTSRQISYPLLVATREAISLLPELGNDRNGLPFTLAIDATGRVRHIRLGGLTEADTETLIASLK